MRFETWQCDACFEHIRHITVHKPDGTELHFCSLPCITAFVTDDALLLAFLDPGGDN